MVRSGTARKRTQRNTKTITVKGSEHKGSATLFFMVFKIRPKKPCPTCAPCPDAPRAPWPHAPPVTPLPHAPPVPLCRAHHSCPVAVGRDVLIAPPRLGAVRGFATRTPWPHAPPAPHRKSLKILCVPIHLAQTLFVLLCVKKRDPLHTATGRCGAMGTSRPTAITRSITPAWGAPPLPTATGRCGVMVACRGSRLAPYRHYTRPYAPLLRTLITHWPSPVPRCRTHRLPPKKTDIPNPLGRNVRMEDNTNTD